MTVSEDMETSTLYCNNKLASANNLNTIRSGFSSRTSGRELSRAMAIKVSVTKLLNTNRKLKDEKPIKLGVVNLLVEDLA